MFLAFLGGAPETCGHTASVQWRQGGCLNAQARLVMRREEIPEHHFGSFKNNDQEEQVETVSLPFLGSCLERPHCGHLCACFLRSCSPMSTDMSTTLAHLKEQRPGERCCCLLAFSRVLGVPWWSPVCLFSRVLLLMSTVRRCFSRAKWCSGMSPPHIISLAWAHRKQYCPSLATRKQ